MATDDAQHWYRKTSNVRLGDSKNLEVQLFVTGC